MKTKAMIAAMALCTAVSATPALAQSTNSWNRETAWRGAPDGLQQRIDWLQQRIDRGRNDGSLSRSEAQRAQREITTLRRDAGNLDQRLDNLSRSLRWTGRGQGGGYGYGNDRDRDRYATDYDASRYYRDDPRYTERNLTYDDEVYRGSDGRYYCKRNDGTTGLIVGAGGGAILGNVIGGGVGGTLIGGALGALLGRTVERGQSQSDVRCR